MTEAAAEQIGPSAEPVCAPDSPPRTLPPHSLAIALVALADWLFYGHAIGLSSPLFLLALAIGAAVANKTHASRSKVLGAAVVLVLAVIPIFIEPSPLAFLFGALATAYFAVTVAGEAGVALRDRIIDAVILLIDGAWRAVADLQQLHRSRPKGRSRIGFIAWTTWIVPLALGSIFLMLFASANPLIEGWLTVFDWKSLFRHLSLSRMLLWAMVTSIIWPFVFLRVRSKLRSALEAEFQGPTPEEFLPTLPAELFGKAAVLRSLVLFNVLFAFQTALDIAYLWGGIALPDGMSYASYAHRGAYPLIVTALLAAAFVMVATRPSSDAERSKLVRNLVFLFTAQNVMLVVSSILRLDLYVEAYSLTYWRLAAFVWMGLVALGLILIVARMALRRSNGWLIGMNLGALALTLYLCGYVSFPKLIADYNVAHSREVSGQGVKLDVQYLLSLGPQAIPAIDRLISQSTSPLLVPCYIRNQPPINTTSCMQVRRSQIAVIHEAMMLDWRTWSYRDWRLARYVKKTRDAEAKSSDAAAAAVRRGWFWD
jgi:hypothetical protein